MLFLILQSEYHDTIVLQYELWVCPPWHCQNGMISLSIGVMLHDRETSIISLTNELVNREFTRDCLSFNTTPISMFLIDIVIA
jgi:hypothetical protein